MPEELDKDLQSMFEEMRLGLTEEPFLGDVLKRIEKRRFRRAIARRLAYVLGLICVASLSPYLIQGSMVLSAGLNVAFAAVNGFVNTSLGVSTAILALLFVSVRRRRISMLV